MLSVWDVFMQKTAQLNQGIIKQIAENSDEIQEDLENWKKSWHEKIKELQELHNNEDTSKENDINSNNQYDSMRIKHEKISMDPLVVVKTENNTMPPPAVGAVKKARKKATSTCSTRSSSRKNDKVEPQIEFDDIMIEEVNVPIVSLCDSDEEPDKTEKIPRVTRSKAKTRKTTKKASLEIDQNVEQPKKKKKIESNKNEQNIDGTFVVEEETHVNETFATNRKKDEKGAEEKDDDNLLNIDETRIKEKPVQNVNKAVAKKTSIKAKIPPDTNNMVIMEKPKLFINKTFVKNPEEVQDSNRPDMHDLLTDDESIEKSLTPVQLSKIKKPVFSTYNASPVKQKIEAFEKLQAESKTDLPPRQTRTKTRADAKKKAQEEPLTVPRTNVKQKIMLQTPVSANKFLLSQMPSSILRTKEKISEASKKRDALLQAKSEERKRIREEKQLKAQQLREIKMKQKLQTNEEWALLKIKEKQERLEKQKEEADQRRILTAKRAQDERKKQEEEKLRCLKEQNKPIYMATAMPLLPTPDCYDSDSDVDTKHIKSSAWEKSASFMKILSCLENSSSTLLQTLFCLKAQTPDLRNIFQNISERKLRRNSSAIWERKPTYSILPTSMSEEFHSLTEDEELFT